LIRIDQQVAEIDDEYTEVCTTLEDMEAEGKGTTLTARELRRLQTDLEEEISEVLKTADHPR
jgi:hypothetical protein